MGLISPQTSPCHSPSITKNTSENTVIFITSRIKAAAKERRAELSDLTSFLLLPSLGKDVS